MKRKIDGFTIVMFVGSYGGFYIYKGKLGLRICLGWIAIDLLACDFDNMIDALKRLDREKDENSIDYRETQTRCPL